MEYFVLAFLPLLFSPLYRLPRRQRVYQVFVLIYFILLILFAGLRWRTGTDWNPYIEYFQGQNNYRFFELGYVYLTALVKSVSHNYTFFLLVDSTIALILIWYGRYRENGCHPISLAMFFSYYYTINYLGSNRRIIAIGLCFLALLALRERKTVVFILLCCAAFFFHRSSLAFVLAWPIYRLKPGAKKYIVLVLAAIAFEMWNPFTHLAALTAGTSNVLLNRVSGYSQFDSLNPNVNYALQDGISLAKRAIFLLLICWGWSKFEPDEKSRYAGYLNIYVFSFALYIAFTGTIEIFKTITVYFSIVELALLPVAFRAIDRKYRPIAYLLFVVLLAAQQYSALNSFWDLYVPYHSVLGK